MKKIILILIAFCSHLLAVAQLDTASLVVTLVSKQAAKRQL
jgi:hypothetical protein